MLEKLNPCSILPPCILVDIDGTLANCDHRRHFVDASLTIVKDFDGYFLNMKGEIFSTIHRNDQNKAIKKLKPYVNKQGYSCIHLYKESKRHRFGIHYLMCRAFHGDRPKGMVVSHLNHNPKDNRPENLCWETQKENIHRKFENGTILGSKNPSAKFSDDQIKDIRLERSKGVLIQDIAKKYCCHRRTIGQICLNRRYSNVRRSILCG